ncbi:MAG: hypothetical protein QM770_12210 [Tepidisphaeraceae bacterium]
MATLSLLVTGIDAAADDTALEVLQSHIARELHDTGFEPAFELTDTRQRPLVATLLLRSPADETARFLVAIADRCFAAAFFRFHGLA